jgi:hypothetical protein
LDLKVVKEKNMIHGLKRRIIATKDLSINPL